MSGSRRGQQTRSAREKLRRGWLWIVIAAVAVPVCFLLSRGREQFSQHMEPGYTTEVSGEWNLTQSRIIGPTAAQDGAAVSASMSEGDLIYDFGGAEGNARVTLHTKAPIERFYEDGHLEFEFRMERAADTERTPGDIVCMFYLADDVTEDENGAAISVRAPLKYAYSGEKEMEPITYETALVRNDRHYAVANMYFPAGQADGETLYVVMEATDDRSAGVRTVMVWQYRWTQGPITVEVPPQPGVIEYYTVFGPLDFILRAAAYVLIVAVPVLLVRQIVLAGKVKKEKAAAPAAAEGMTGNPDRIDERRSDR